MGNNTLLGMSWNLLCSQPCTVYRVVVSQGECCNNGEKGVATVNGYVASTNLCNIMKIFSNSKCDLYPISGGFIRVYSCTGTLNSRSMLQALYHSQTQTHTHSHTSQACTHIVPNITAYFQAETFCLLRCKVMKFLKLTCETVKQCVYKENTQIYICVCVCRYVRVNRILRM